MARIMGSSAAFGLNGFPISENSSGVNQALYGGDKRSRAGNDQGHFKAAAPGPSASRKIIFHDGAEHDQDKFLESPHDADRAVLHLADRFSDSTGVAGDQHAEKRK